MLDARLAATAGRHALGCALAAAALVCAPTLAQTTTLGDGANPPYLGVQCPGAAPTAVDAFTLRSTGAGEQVTSLRIQLHPPGAHLFVERVEVRDDGGSIPAYGSVAPGADRVDVPLVTPLPVTASETQFKLYLTPRRATEIGSSPTGLPTTVAAQVVDFTARYAKAGADTTSRYLTVDNAADPPIALSPISTTPTSVTLSWGTTARKVLVLRSIAGPVTDRPVNGTAYGATLGQSAVLLAGPATQVGDEPLDGARPYYYRAVAFDDCLNYSAPIDVGPVYPGGRTEGDATPGSARPVVALVNPGQGTVSLPLRVQVRVFSPRDAGGARQPVGEVILECDDGAGRSTVPLVQNPGYGSATDSGIWETTLDPTRLTPGTRYTLRASATNGSSPPLAVWSSPVGIRVGVGKGDGNLLVRDNSEQLCSDCHALPPHSSESLGSRYGSWYSGCRTCHDPHGTTNASLVSTRITPPAVSGQLPSSPVVFSTRTGYAAAGGAANPSAASYANRDATGVCQVCHTRTTRWRSDGVPDAVHVGRCGFCHGHASGFAGQCGTCHPSPPSIGAHEAHAGASAPRPPFPGDPRPLGCGNCHPTDPAFHGDGKTEILLNPDLVLPGGTRTSGARLRWTSGGAACLAACHFPLGAAPPTDWARWSSTGPLPCRSCHSRIVPDGAAPSPRAGPSLHDPNFSEARPASGEPTTCHSCHDSTRHDATHLTGAPGLLPNGTVDAVCITCHAPPSGPAAGPPGQTLHAGTDPATARTPPILIGWSTTTVDAVSGDFHGGRRGTCFGSLGPEPCAPTVTPTGHGGTLKAPYQRGEPAMPCATCHAGHSSANAFLFAATVNGTPIPAGSIDRTGVGAERLCEACHEGGRHDRCVACHTDAYFCDENAQCWMDGAANHVDPAPAGSACFFCHGHRGVLRWTSPYGPHGHAPTDCSHCHGGIGANGGRPPRWVPPVFAPPKLPNGPPVVSSITATSATVTWRTDVNASTWVEYGVGMPGYVAGSAAESWDHAVTLTDLQPGTTYVWRIRSVDAYRNVLRTSVASLRTTPAGGVPFPDVVPVGWTGVAQPDASMGLALTWYPVAASTGNPVEYRVELAEDPGFTFLLNGSPADSGWIPGTPGTRSGREVRSFGVTLTNLPADWCVDPIPYNQYYWRVKARDAVTGVESDWSAVDPFQATSFDPIGC